MSQPLSHNPPRAAITSLADLCPYDRAAVTAGIVHFGVGGFHRAHEAMYLDRLMRAGQAYEWGICGIGVMPSDQRMRDVLRAQSGLYTLLQRHPDGTEQTIVIGSIIDFLYAPDDPEAVIAKVADPATKVVSLTVTEGGYNIHRVTGEFDTSNPKIIAEVQSADPPSSVFGLVTGALQRRRDAGQEPFTISSCDNIQGNGDIARGAFVGYARMRDRPLADWIQQHVAFPNSMVDRITPATTQDDIDHLKQAFGIADGWPVVCEPFEQWVLEDHFSAGRPPYEQAGVQMVADVEPMPGTRHWATSATCSVTVWCTKPPRIRRLPPSSAATWTKKAHQPCSHCPALTWTATRTTCWNASPIPTFATRCKGFAWKAPTASQNSCFQWCASNSPMIGR